MASRKLPSVAAILNFVIPGAGYLYAGRRLVFGAGLVLCLIGSILIGFFAGFQQGFLGISSGIPGMSNDANFAFVTGLSIILSALFAYDGYKTAEEANGGK